MATLICDTRFAFDLSLIPSIAVLRSIKASDSRQGLRGSLPSAEGEDKYHVTLLDYGANHGIMRSLSGPRLRGDGASPSYGDEDPFGPQPRRAHAFE